MSPAVTHLVRRSAPPLLACAVAAITLTWMAFHQGGYFEDVRLTAAVVLWIVLAVLCAVELPRLRLSTPALAALAALALLVAWTALSTTWTSDTVRGERLVDLDLLYVAVFAIGLIAAGNGRHARDLLLAAFAVCVVVVGAALWARLHPGTFGSPQPEQVVGYRMDWPLGYWNALGGIGAMGAILALGLAAVPRSHPAVRAIGASASVLCLVACYLTFSRGSVVAFAVGVLILLALGVHRSSLIASLLVVGLATAVLLVRLEATPELTTDPGAGAGAAEAGRSFTPMLLGLLAAAAAAQFALTIGNRSVAVADLVRKTRRPLTILVTGLVVLTCLGAYVVKADAVEGRVAEAIEDTQHWFDRQWDEFNRPGIQSEAEQGSARLDTTAGTRSDLWSVAKDAFTSAPLRGTGAGSYQVEFFRERSVTENVQNAHSLPYETLGELGLVGFATLLLFLGAIVVAAIRSRRRRLALPTTQTAAAGAAVAVWLVHASVDWDWQMPAFTGLALLIAATLFPAATKRRRRRSVQQVGG
jgi:O-antigen ligase